MTESLQIKVEGGDFEYLSKVMRQKIGDKISTKYEIYENLFFRPNLTVQYDKLEANNSASSLLKNRQGNYKTTSLGYNFSIDERDSRSNPTSGYIIYFDQNIATLISDVPTVQTSFGSTLYDEIIKIGRAHV